MQIEVTLEEMAIIREALKGEIESLPPHKVPMEWQRLQMRLSAIHTVMREEEGA